MIYAYLNIFDDIIAIKKTIFSYYDKVDKIIAIDGAYEGLVTKFPYSTDGTREFLEKLDKVTFIPTDHFWKNQREKRSEFWKYGTFGDFVFIIDADEEVTHFDNSFLESNADIFTVRINPPLSKDSPYTSPRIFKWQPNMTYQMKHHHLYKSNQFYCSHRTVCPDALVEANKTEINHLKGFGRDRQRELAYRKYKYFMVQEETSLGRKEHSKNHKVAILTPYDPAGMSYALAEAINLTSPSEAKFHKHSKCHIEYGEGVSMEELVEYSKSCDILHYNVNYDRSLINRKSSKKKIVLHHHGTFFRRRPEVFYKKAESIGAVQLVSNLELLKYGKDLTFLENLVPFGRYRDMKRRSKDNIFRIAHSPTKRALKGTQVFLKAVENLKKKGFLIEPVLIENKTHIESLKLKSNVNAIFDSFWLGMQVSGLEGACMNIPVLAGDKEQKDLFLENYGLVPYTLVFEDTLEDEIVRLYSDKVYYYNEAAKVHEFVRAFHSYGYVVDKYFQILEGKGK